MSTAEKHIPAVLVERKFDATELNAVINHPEVLPWLQGSAAAPLDFTALATDPRNVLLSGTFGSVLCVPTSPGIWMLTIQVLPEGRGEWTLGLLGSAFSWMFTHTDAVEILTQVPQGQLGGLTLARRCGATQEWKQSGGWSKDGAPVDVSYWGVTLQAWLRGEFAAWLEEEAQRFLAVVAPGVEPRSDMLRPLGFFLAALRGGQAPKGCVFFNRWAAVAGFSPAFLAGLDPLTVSLGGTLFEVSSAGEIIATATSH